MKTSTINIFAVIIASGFIISGCATPLADVIQGLVGKTGKSVGSMDTN